jgi:hypothetical protein
MISSTVSYRHARAAKSTVNALRSERAIAIWQLILAKRFFPPRLPRSTEPAHLDEKETVSRTAYVRQLEKSGESARVVQTEQS